MRDPNGPTITISGKLMVAVPTDLSVEDGFSNFEELARGAKVEGFNDRLELLGALQTLGGLLGIIPEVGAREALSIFEQVAMAHSCNHHLRMALLQSVDLLEDVVETEEARVRAEAEPKSAEGDGPSETAEGKKAVPSTAPPSS